MAPAIAFFAFLGVLALVVFLMLRRPDPLAEARKSGDAARVVRVVATIDAVQDTGSRHNYNPVIALTLRYTSADGRAHTARIERPVPPLAMPQIGVGRQLLLEYDAADPARADLVDPLTSPQP